MIAYECNLITTQYSLDAVGNEIAIKTNRTIPIIEVQDVYSSEFYQASQNGFKPTLRIRTSTLNYNDESLLEYCDKEYTIIRVDMLSLDEIALICERKISNEN